MPWKETPEEALPPVAFEEKERMTNALQPEKLEAEELADKIKRDKVKKPTGYLVKHDSVGDGKTEWCKDTKLTPDDLERYYTAKGMNKIECEDAINRLVAVNAIVPTFS